MIDTILFDLDGTIINTNELIIASFLNVMDKHHPGTITREEIIPFMGQTLEQQLHAFTGLNELSHLVTDYRAYNQIHHDTMVKEFPHVREVIAKLHESSYKLGVVTTKMRMSTIKALDMFDLTQYMGCLVTLDRVEHPKPHPEPILMALAELNADPARTLMVGDSAADLQSARAAGVKSAAVAWSLKGVEVLQKYEPDYILNDMTDLYDILAIGV